MNEYRFSIGDAREILIEANNEKEALLKLIEMYWDIIDNEGEILLYGQVIEKQKLYDMEEEIDDE